MKWLKKVFEREMSYNDKLKILRELEKDGYLESKIHRGQLMFRLTPKGINTAESAELDALMEGKL